MMVAVFDMFDQIYLKQPDKNSPEVQNFGAVLYWIGTDLTESTLIIIPVKHIPRDHSTCRRF